MCETGEYYADRICSPCRNGTYSITDPAALSLAEIREVSVCKACPSGVASCFADTLVLKEGYWRIGTQAVDVLTCPMAEESCVGGGGTGHELCAEGYEVSGRGGVVLCAVWCAVCCALCCVVVFGVLCFLCC